MQRRDFIKKAAIATAGAMVLPYILPSGRLFAATDNRKVNHVVLVLFAGGLRNIETVKQNQSNLMSTMLKDITPFAVQAGINEILPASPLPGGKRLQEYGTLMKEFRFKEGPTGHYNGHMTSLTGRYSQAEINLRTNPEYPTIFEYYRKHNDDASKSSALNSWWISNSLGPYPALNYSSYTGYGAAYGANYIQPSSIISMEGYNALGNPKTFTQQEMEMVNKIHAFCDANFAKQYAAESVGVVNSTAEREQLNMFMAELFQDAMNGAGFNSWGFNSYVSNDLVNLYYAEKVIEKFKPELTVLNMQDVDICHTDFTQHCNLLRRADWGVSHLWNKIQNTPGMADDTVMIVVPEHGRNITSNTVIDAYGRPAFDHNSDATSREIFCLMCGPSAVIHQDKVISTEYGESIDVIPTIAELLGFRDRIPSGMLNGQVLSQAIK
ncbi:MAG: hypothetical protein ACO3E1_08550 [Flavobacteriales bacterium]